MLDLLEQEQEGKLGRSIRLNKLFQKIWHSFQYSVHKSDWIRSAYLFWMQYKYSIDLIRPQIESKKALFVQAYPSEWNWKLK